MSFGRHGRLRIAFVTTEFVSDIRDGGGLGGYLSRITAALRTAGHEVEVFTQAQDEPGVAHWEGLRVERVGGSRTLGLRWFGRLGRVDRRLLLPQANAALVTATGLAQGLLRRHRAAPFDFVHSSNTGIPGFLLPRSLRHVMRLSNAIDLWLQTDNAVNADSRWDCEVLGALERRAVRSADVAFAPSRFLRDFFRERHRIEIKTLRPPAPSDLEIGPMPAGVPERYMIHFGTITGRKGSDLVAAALPLAWRQEPELRMVWAGRELPAGTIDGFRQRWGDNRDKVHCLGPLERPALFAVLRGAVASVSPSRVDNLPNTVIESLACGVPVIGSAGASIDELVVDGRSGRLVRIGDIDALAEAMVAAWRGEPSWIGEGFEPPEILERMRPEVAAENLVRLAMG